VIIDQRDHLQETISLLRAANPGADSPFVMGLQTQLDSLRKAQPGKHAENPVSMVAGVRSTKDDQAPKK